MNHPFDKSLDELMQAADQGPEAMENWLKDLQEKVGAPDGADLPDSITIVYDDGTKETFDITKPVASQGRLPTFYNHENPAPQSVIDEWSKDKDE